MMSSLLEVLKTKTFLEKVLLLLLGATITGIFVPIVKSSMDKRQFEQQKRFEATVARQAEILKTQSNFLREFAEYVWENKCTENVEYLIFAKKWCLIFLH